MTWPVWAVTRSTRIVTLILLCAWSRADRAASLWRSLSWLDKVGRDTTTFAFSFTAWVEGGDTCLKQWLLLNTAAYSHFNVYFQTHLNMLNIIKLLFQRTFYWSPVEDPGFISSLWCDTFMWFKLTLFFFFSTFRSSCLSHRLERASWPSASPVQVQRGQKVNTLRYLLRHINVDCVLQIHNYEAEFTFNVRISVTAPTVSPCADIM